MDMEEGKDSKFIPMTSVMSGVDKNVTEDVSYYTDQIANVVMIETSDKDGWVLVDAGLPGGADNIKKAAEERFGEGTKPRAILLTHGHFDHVGGLIELVRMWEVPVYAHELELPYLTGEKSYPVPDASVEGGALAKISPMYPNDPINLGDAVHSLPSDGTVPELQEWEWFHTPGHAPGHVSFYKKSDRLLAAGDAFVTVRQDSFYKVLMQTEEVNGPPRYLTTDWDKARESVEKLAALNPDMAVTGHGIALEGEQLQEGLDKLAAEFNDLAVPDYGKFVDDE